MCACVGCALCGSVRRINKRFRPPDDLHFCKRRFLALLKGNNPVPSLPGGGLAGASVLGHSGRQRRRRGRHGGAGGVPQRDAELRRRLLPGLLRAGGGPGAGVPGRGQRGLRGGGGPVGGRGGPTEGFRPGRRWHRPQRNTFYLCKWCRNFVSRGINTATYSGAQANSAQQTNKLTFSNRLCKF